MWKDELSLRVCTVALPPPPPPPPPANIWSICCISCCWAAFVPALLGEEAGFSVGMPPAVGMPGTPPVGMPGTPPVGMPGTPPDIKLSQKGKKKLKNNFYKKKCNMSISVRANLGMRPGASVCSVCKPCWICIRACMARGLVMTDRASGFCICNQTEWQQRVNQLISSLFSIPTCQMSGTVTWSEITRVRMRKWIQPFKKNKSKLVAKKCLEGCFNPRDKYV